MNDYQSNQANNYENQSNASTNINAAPPKKRSSAGIIAGIVLILIGISHIVNVFFPWVLQWLDTGIIFALIAIVAGFALIVRK